MYSCFLNRIWRFNVMATATTVTVFKKLPGVLAFQRGLVISDAELFNEIDGEYEAYPVPIVRHGIRGTQNVNTTGSGDTATSGDTKQRAVSNIQQTDSAKLDSRADALITRFAIRFLDLDGALFACAPGKVDTDDEVAALRDSIKQFIERAKSGVGIDEVARRIARNIANARWLWRNRLIASKITVMVSHPHGEIARFESLQIPLNEFSDYSDAEKAVAQVIADGLRGREVAALTVAARVEFGVRGAIEVFPSQNYIENKPDGFARSLYRLGQPEKSRPEDGPRIMGRAAIRDQKISNALRTIDTWYPNFAEHGRPIPVEPNGANLEAQRFFRDQKGASAFDLVRRLNQVDPSTNDGMFLTACLIRGGVNSEGG
jgi:CRISPR-associated protein Csy3